MLLRVTGSWPDPNSHSPLRRVTESDRNLHYRVIRKETSCFISKAIDRPIGTRCYRTERVDIADIAFARQGSGVQIPSAPRAAALRHNNATCSRSIFPGFRSAYITPNKPSSPIRDHPVQEMEVKLLPDY